MASSFPLLTTTAITSTLDSGCLPVYFISSCTTINCQHQCQHHSLIHFSFLFFPLQHFTVNNTKIIYEHLNTVVQLDNNSSNKHGYKGYLAVELTQFASLQIRAVMRMTHRPTNRQTDRSRVKSILTLLKLVHLSFSSAKTNRTC